MNNLKKSEKPEKPDIQGQVQASNPLVAGREVETPSPVQENAQEDTKNRRSKVLYPTPFYWPASLTVREKEAVQPKKIQPEIFEKPIEKPIEKQDSVWDEVFSFDEFQSDLVAQDQSPRLSPNPNPSPSFDLDLDYSPRSTPLFSGFRSISFNGTMHQSGDNMPIYPYPKHYKPKN